jgi:hypothetical protein
MKKKSAIFLGALLVIVMLGILNCKNDHEDNQAQPNESPLFTVGQIVTSEFSADDVVMERMVDTVVNLGSQAEPALFYVNERHTLNDLPIETGNSYRNVFRSLSRADIYNFIVIWGELYGFRINLNDQTEEGITLRQRAFYLLQEFLKEYEIDLPMLISLGKDSTELSSAVNLVKAAGATMNIRGSANPANSPDPILRSIEMANILPSELLGTIRSSGLTETEFMKLVNQKGIDLAASLKKIGPERQVVYVVAGVIFALKFVTKRLIKVIENGVTVVDIENDYVSYLHEDDINVMHYVADPTPSVSPTYSVAYCTLAKCSFYIETYYKGIHSTLPGWYIPRAGMIVQSVKCSLGMHVTGEITYDIGYTEGTNEEPVANSNGTVVIKYGDCCCFKRKGVLTYNVNGLTGYTQTTWDPNVK